MITYILVAMALSMLPGHQTWHHNVSIDTTTGLTRSEKHGLDAAIVARRTRLLSSPVVLSRTELEYQSVCPECFKRSLACGKLDPYNTVYSCMHESVDSFGTDEAIEANTNTKEGNDKK